MINIGTSIETFLETIDKARFSLNEITDKGAKVSTINGKNFTITVSVDPKKWLSMDLDTCAPTLRKINYHIDSDLYPPSDSNLQYYQDIEREILNVLTQITTSSVKIGKERNRTILVIPSRGHYVVIERGIFLTKQQEVEHLPTADLVALT